MAPPGRRRNANVLMSLLLSILLLLPSHAVAQSVVLGIDLGTEYIKAALVKPGIPLEIVLSKDSKRKETAAVGFKTPKKIVDGQFPERAYGSDALAVAARFPNDVYPNLKQLLGLPVENSEAIERYGNAYPGLEIVETGVRKTSGFKSPSFGAGEPPFTVEEILAMELKNVKENAQLLAGKAFKVSNAVFTVPIFYTAEERKALKLAAELAGLNILGLVSDGLAVGINYATTREFPNVSDELMPEHHMVVNIGAGSTTATVLKFQSRTVKDIGRFNKTIQEVIVIGAGWDRSLGGDALNQMVVDDMVEKFVASPGVKKSGKKISFEDVRTHGRTAAKLLRDAEKARQVLSANQETVASFEELYEEVDFKYKLSRTAFEAMTTEFADRLEAPVKQALKSAQITFDSIESIILHGGTSRTPFVQKKLEALAGSTGKIRTNVNADEAAVFGAAFKGARLSPSFRVKEIVDRDIGSLATWVRYQMEDANGKEQHYKLFTPSSSVGISKLIPFNQNLDDFKFTIFQTLGSEPGTPKDGAASFTISTHNLTKSVKELTEKYGCNGRDITHAWSIRLDTVMGMPEIVEGTVSCEGMADEPKAGILDDAKGFFGFGKKDDKQQVLKDDKSATSTEDASEKAARSAMTSTEAPKPTTTKRVVKLGYDLSDNTVNVPAAEVKRMRDRLVAFDGSDKSRRGREEDMNNLEGFTYKVRDYLSDAEFATFVPAAELKALDKLQKQTSEWMSEDAASATSAELKEKLKALTTIVNPALKRQHEAMYRPELLETLEGTLNSTKGFVDMIRESIVAKEKIDAEAAKSSAEAAAASATESSESAGASPADALADLEEDQEALPSALPVAIEDAMPPLEMAPYSKEELAELEETHDTIKAWLEEKSKVQESLKPYEDSPFEGKELSQLTTKLNQAIMKLMTRAMKPPPKPKADPAKKKAPKVKGKGKKKSKAKTDSESGAASSSASTKDEL